MKNLETTLLVIVKNNKIMLGEKKRGFGKGKLNAVGGKRQEGEQIYDTMLRETMEEIGVKPIGAQIVGIIDFKLFIDGEKANEKMHIFLAKDYIGEPFESDEMKPEWFDTNNIPYERMFADDMLWLPEVLKGNKIQAEVDFDENFNMIYQKFEVVDEPK